MPPARPSVLGAQETVIIYRRDREHMPAHDFEVEEALEEGVVARWLRTIREVDDTTLTVEKMVLDENGFPQPTGRGGDLGSRYGDSGTRAKSRYAIFGRGGRGWRSMPMGLFRLMIR
jgi:NADPH-dependent glutamate synthase beta subunit-like oxidoreductase